MAVVAFNVTPAPPFIDGFVRGPTLGGVTFVNRVIDTLAGGAGPTAFVRWVTSDPDPAGTSYPAGNGTFGVDTSDYCVESRIIG